MVMHRNKPLARRFFKRFASTKRDGTSPCSFACGTFGDETRVALYTERTQLSRSANERRPVGP
jgi:hypothetical protein